MATTTNYGWTTPDDTSLVKDGAAAIRTLGSSVDTTTKALNPSTTLGDLEYRSATANTNTRLGVGTTGQLLTVAGGVPTWANPPATTPSFVGAAAYNSTTTSVANATFTTLPLNSELFDTSGFHDTATNNSRFTVPSGKAGYYEVSYNITYEGYSTAVSLSFVMTLNGSSLQNSKAYAGAAGGEQNWQFTRMMNLSVGDYLEAQVWHNAGTSRSFYMLNGQGQANIKYLGA